MAKRTKRNTDLQHITLKSKDQVTRNTLNIGSELRYSGRVNSSYFTCSTRRGIIVTNSMIRHERGKDRIVITTNGTYRQSFVTQILRHG